MDIQTYLSETKQTKSGFAGKVGITPTYLTQILKRVRQPAPGLCLKFVRATGGVIKLKDLRPDLTEILDLIRLAENGGSADCR